MAKITSLNKTAKKAGLKIGDEIVSIDSFQFEDVLDLIFYDSKEKFAMEVLRDGKAKKIEIEKLSDQSLGIEIDDELSPARCLNKCSFCFIDQLPCGLREQLYVKDDDYRFSFITGSYVTLTNLKEKDIERILRLKLSPLYISVHAYNDTARLNLVKNPNSKNLIEIMERLSSGNIKMHAQIVLVPDVNDGKILAETIEKLHEIQGVLSVAVVPVGLTKFRDKLEQIKPLDKLDARAAIETTEELNKKFGGGFVWCSDEIYLKAQLELPSYDDYGTFPQIENGVGLLRDFEDNLFYSLENSAKLDGNKSIGLITGVSFSKRLKNYAEQIEEKLGVKIQVFEVKNKFFGESVTVAGLITATDILEQVSGDVDGYIIPSNMLKEFSSVFLDNFSLPDLEKSLNKKIIIAAANGSDLVAKIAEV